ncbi:MAG: sugar phosphate isomerase/epimerase [Phycisphaerales bacterium]|nr:sugar phosphate isomerase/epimerase [Phycisphaerales bacterium]
MKLAFSSVGCPAWDLATMVEKAKEYGYQGIELRGLEGQMHLPLAPQLASNPAKIAMLMRETGVEIVCLSTSAAFHMRDGKEVAKNQSDVREYIELAGKLECPYVRVFGAEIPKLRFKLLGYERRETVLARIATSLRELASYAAAHRVTILIENSGDFQDSAAMWYLVEAADSPAVKCCWNPLNAATRNERPTISIPRLGLKIGMVHLSDGKFGGSGGFDGHVAPGQGAVEIPRLVQLLKGIGYRGYLCFDWPKLWDASLADPDKVFPATASYLQPMIDEKPIPLTAYKTDKFAPKFDDEAAVV